ncbi:DUF7836 family putative zinc-binding protein [Halosegnis rubeus]|jgi:predicted RNA-binding Zn-ribbon protein involved in translation (DUF1610 family)|uniref:DUF7836 family putative zinc-binding protein n=1 Tax=Halosegnis rubeus TaxID=2212850 RepID=UPI00186A9112|nr:hypothetical protein [Halosegnis rubeus]
MVETYVRLLCPDCEKSWEESPNDLPEPSETFYCPDCNAENRLSEFARTERDLETMQTL